MSRTVRRGESDGHRPRGASGPPVVDPLPTDTPDGESSIEAKRATRHVDKAPDDHELPRVPYQRPRLSIKDSHSLTVNVPLAEPTARNRKHSKEMRFWRGLDTRPLSFGAHVRSSLNLFARTASALRSGDAPE